MHVTGNHASPRVRTTGRCFSLAVWRALEMAHMRRLAHDGMCEGGIGGMCLMVDECVRGITGGSRRQPLYSIGSEVAIAGGGRLRAA